MALSIGQPVRFAPEAALPDVLRMEQSGFRPDQQQAYQGAKGGWQQFFAALEQVLARID
jgi:uncharacterized protein YndB with AHSA1/START domain